MAQEATDSEPTMEEILASIKRIINEDDEPDTAEADDAVEAEAEAEPAQEPEPESDVLELTEKVEATGQGTDPLAIEDDLMIVDREDDEMPAAAEPEAEPEPEPVAEDEPEPEPEPELEPVAETPPPPRDSRREEIVIEDDEDSLLDQTAASAAAGAFGALSNNLRIAGTDGQTLEAIVRELMRPMLKEWLDANLPRIVEEKVEAEIERVARRR